MIGGMDVSVFDAVPTQLSGADRRSVLAVQQIIAERHPGYAYLEIGSYLGGSLQPHLQDARCAAVYSIDARPPSQPDERGMSFDYPDNTTARMIESLTPAYADALAKLSTFDLDASALPSDAILSPPRLCLIDGEHTDRAVVSDFSFCLNLLERPGVILFDDAHIVYRGISACLKVLRRDGVAHRAYVLPDKIGVIEIGSPDLFCEPQLGSYLATADSYLFLAETLDPYRRRLLRLLTLPGIRQIRAARARLLTRGRPSGGSTRAR